MKKKASKPIMTEQVLKQFLSRIEKESSDSNFETKSDHKASPPNTSPKPSLFKKRKASSDLNASTSKRKGKEPMDHVVFDLAKILNKEKHNITEAMISLKRFKSSLRRKKK